ncbi:PREDICTED: probable disease resistance protein At4g27220 isoform X2 [Nelumbo nucifera]|nr:PREDICTED: probable disease resistance protein At4g27220 isoform X2 [Nelumbo nucifera]
MVSVVSSFVLGKAKDVLIGIAEDWVKDKVKDKVGYLLDSKGKIEELKVVREEIQKAVKEAEKKGEDVKDEVQNLLIDMEGIMENWNKLRTESNYEPSSLHSIYTLSKEAVEKMKSIDELLPKKLYSVSNPAPLPTMESIYKGDFKVFESTKLTMDKVMEALKDENIHVIGVYGMGGVGKTSLAKEVGKQVEKEKLFDKVVMAVVSQEPNHKEMQGQIADMLGLKFEEESVMGRALKLSRRLEKVGSILVILDDIWAKLELKELGIPFDGNNMGCKILFTTRRQDVCHAMKTQADIPLSILSEDDAWDLFRRNAGDVVENDALIRDVAKDVAKECGGLPIAIVTVAGALRDKRDRQEWDYARRELRLSEFQNIEDLDLKVRSCLKWSYDYLRDLEAQRLFLHCCLFPEDYAIYIEDLILYSFGVGLLKNAETIEDARCRTRRIVKKLKASSLLLQGWDEESIKMHDVVRDVAIHIASNKGEHDELFLVRGGNLEEWPTMESTADYTAISLIYHRIRKLPNSLEFSKLRTLVLRRAYVQMEIPDTFFQGMMALRSLDMSFNYGLHILPSSIQWLTNLRTLNLQECIILEDISMLGNLKGLVILNLSGCEYIEGLPENMAQLTNLRSLNLTGASGIKIIPPNVISCWSQLEELLMDSSFKDWEIEGISGGGGHGCKARLAELNALRRLTSLQVEIKDPRSLPDDFVFQDLGVFHIDINFRDSYDYRIEKVLRIKGLRTQEKELCIKGIRTQKIKTVFSNQLKKTKVLRLQDCEGLNLCGCSDIEDFPSRALFSNLNILDLKECKSLRSIFSPINTRNLQQLEDLRVEGCDSLEEIFVEEEGGDKIVLPKLKTLFLSKLPSLTSICGNRNPSDWPSLELVDIYCCPNLRGIFSRATTQSLLQLKKLEVHNCDSLEEIFVKEGEGEAVVDKIALPQLRTLHLKHLPSLTSIYGNKNPSDWPSLELVYIHECPSLLHFPFQRQRNAPNLKTITISSVELSRKKLRQKYQELEAEFGELLRL